MDKCGICLKPAVQLFETGKDGVYACFKCQPLVPEVTIDDNTTEITVVAESSSGNEEETDTALFCGICQKSFQRNAQLQNHLRNHRAERRFLCTYCNKAFSQSNNLRAHLRIHTNERPYKCSECGKAFTQVTNLNNHVRLHTGERPFVCPEPGCNKAYAQVTNLNQHRKRHLNGRPVESTYDCTVCGEQFQQRNYMYNHRRKVHGELKSPVRSPPLGSRLACASCDVSFGSERQLAQHEAEHAERAARRERERERERDDHDEPDDDDSPGEGAGEGEGEGAYPCVFSSCGARLSSPRAHTEHLLRAHQLRVLAARDARRPPRRGRPPKAMKTDPLAVDPKEDSVFEDVKIIKVESQFLPKLKVQSLFQ